MPGVGPGVERLNPVVGQRSSDPRVRPAEGKVSKAAAQAVTGPQTSQETNPFGVEILRFPEDIGTRNDIPKLLHWIKFTPCIQEKSSYRVTTTGPSNTDINRASAGNMAGSADPYGKLESGAIATGLAGLSAAEAAFDFAKTAATGSVKDVFAAAQKAKGEAAIGTLAAGISGAIIANIDLSRKTRRAANYICLYMPDTVNVQAVNQYQDVSLTAAMGKAGLVAAVGGSIENQLSDVASGAKMIRAGKGAPGDVSAGGVAEAAGLVAEKTGNFGQGIGDVLLFSAGLAQNPQIELLFKTINNREFQFDFKFVPKNRDEAATIRKIINSFRFFAAPEIPKGSSGRYFIPPSEFDIDFMLGSDRNPNLPKLSTCALEGIDVNFGSAGQWTAFQDGMPVEISMQLRFKELEIMHKALIKEGY